MRMMDEWSWASKMVRRMMNRVGDGTCLRGSERVRWVTEKNGRDGSNICWLGSMAAGLVQIGDGGREKLRVEMERKSEDRDERIDMKEKEEKK